MGRAGRDLTRLKLAAFIDDSENDVLSYLDFET